MHRRFPVLVGRVHEVVDEDEPDVVVHAFLGEPPVKGGVPVDFPQFGAEHKVDRLGPDPLLRDVHRVPGGEPVARLLPELGDLNEALVQTHEPF
jgi:hypothetical protein